MAKRNKSPAQSCVSRRILKRRQPVRTYNNILFARVSAYKALHKPQLEGSQKRWGYTFVVEPKKFQLLKSLNFQRTNNSFLTTTIIQGSRKFSFIFLIAVVQRSVVDPDPDVFESPGSGSGSVVILDGSESGSLHQQAKKVRKTLISTN